MARKPKGAQAKLWIALVVEDPEDAVMVPFCITSMTASVDTTTQKATDNCDYNEAADKVYTREEILEEGMSFDITAYTALTTSQEAILKARYVGEVWMLQKTGKYFHGSEGIIKNPKFMFQTDQLQTYSFTLKINGLFEEFVAGPPPGLS